jgi:hypothetical protein
MPTSPTVPITPEGVRKTRMSVPGGRNSDGLVMDPNVQDPSDEDRQFLLEREADHTQGVTEDDEEMARKFSDEDERYE